MHVISFLICCAGLNISLGLCHIASLTFCNRQLKYICHSFFFCLFIKIREKTRRLIDQVTSSLDIAAITLTVLQCSLFHLVPSCQVCHLELWAEVQTHTKSSIVVNELKRAQFLYFILYVFPYSHFICHTSHFWQIYYTYISTFSQNYIPTTLCPHVLSTNLRFIFTLHDNE